MTTEPITFGPQDAAEVNILSMLKDPKVTEAEKRGALVEEILHRFKIATFEDTQEILWCREGVYVQGGEQQILAELQNMAGFEITNHMRSEIMSTIRAMTYKPRSEFDKDPDILNLKNGLLSLKTGEFAPHSWAHLSLTQLPVEYDPEATCRPIIEALYNTFEDPTDVPLFLEWLAYCLFWRNKDLQKELMMIGPPECGKSKILDILIRLLGSENVSAVTFQQLSTNRFALAQLYGKLANIYADITHTRVEDIERFKAIATADEVEAEKKGMQLFKFRPIAKQTYSTNIPPKPPLNVDDSFYRRWILIKCAWRERDYFTGRIRSRDRKILDKLATPEYLSGLLNLAIISAHRLLNRGQFCKEPPTESVRDEYDRLSNPVKLWVEETCEEVDEDQPYVTKQEAHQSYVKFCKSRNIAPLNEIWMAKEMLNLGYFDQQVGTGKSKKRVWIGLQLKIGTGKAPSDPPSNQTTLLLVEKGKDPLPVPNLEGLTN